MAIALKDLVKKVAAEHPSKSNAKYDYEGIYQKLVELGRPVTPAEAAKVAGLKYQYVYSWMRRHTVSIEEAQKLVDEGKTNTIAFIRAGNAFIPLATAVKLAQEA